MLPFARTYTQSQSQQQADVRPRARVNQPERPMLARVADSMFWMSRYVERAEHVARLLRVTSNLLTDVGELAPALQERQWLDVVRIMHLSTAAVPSGADLSDRVQRYLAFDPGNPNSIASAVGRARENARAIRSDISAEMWESLNEFYWATRGGEALGRFEENREEYYDAVANAGMLFQGLTDQTLAHDGRWLFTQLAKYLERLDVTCRVVRVRYEFVQDMAAREAAILQSAGPTAAPADATLRNIHLMAALRMCCSIEAYRRQHLNELDAIQVAAFLILEKNHPRSVRYAVDRAHEAAADLHRTTGRSGIDPAERTLGRLATQLEYAEVEELLRPGLSNYLEALCAAANDAGHDIRLRYFPR